MIARIDIALGFVTAENYRYCAIQISDHLSAKSRDNDAGSIEAFEAKLAEKAIDVPKDHVETLPQEPHSLNNISGRNISRRLVFKGGVACALTALFVNRLSGETLLGNPTETPAGQGGHVSRQPDLYVFRGMTQGTVALAIIWQENNYPGPAHPSWIRFHAGAKSWQFRVPVDGSSFVDRINGFAAFVGNIRIPAKDVDGTAKAAVIELDARELETGGRAGIWAEHMNLGKRVRVGTPFQSAIVSEGGSFAKLYHMSSPSQDQEVLLGPLADEIARRFQSSDTSLNSSSHSRRLASVLLPDVLHYDPNAPTGFTFATRNGRHPSEATAKIVDTIMSGTMSPKLLRNPAPIYKPTFPYFDRDTIVA